MATIHLNGTREYYQSTIYQLPIKYQQPIIYLSTPYLEVRCTIPSSFQAEPLPEKVSSIFLKDKTALLIGNLQLQSAPSIDQRK